MDSLSLLDKLAQNLIWVAPVGNDCKVRQRLINGRFVTIPVVRGFMVCRRVINNPDGPNTRVEYLRADPTAACRWKKPFRENEHLFTNLLEALTAAENECL